MIRPFIENIAKEAHSISPIKDFIFRDYRCYCAFSPSDIKNEEFFIRVDKIKEENRKTIMISKLEYEYLMEAIEEKYEEELMNLIQEFSDESN